MILLQGFGRIGYVVQIPFDRFYDIFPGVEADHAEQGKQLRILRPVGLAYFLGSDFLHVNGPGNAVDNPVRNRFPGAAVGLGQPGKLFTDLSDSHGNDSADDTLGISAETVTFIRQLRNLIFTRQLRD